MELHLEMKHRLPAMILLNPGFSDTRRGSFAIIRMSDKNFPQSGQAFRKISEDFSGHFALVAARRRMRATRPAWSFRLNGK